MSRRWPDHLWIVRHGQSAGNVAREAAAAAGHAVIDIGGRDTDVQLSELGEEQSTALGKWFSEMPEAERPTTVLSSTYARAIETANLIVRAGGTGPDAGRHCDERLREREFGVLDRLTSSGIMLHFPEQAEARSRLGKFYHRPPGGESWCDVILRLRSVLDTVSLHYARPGSRVLIVAHQVVVLCLRYLLENMTEEQILAIDREQDVANCGVTEYVRDHGDTDSDADDVPLRLVRYNFVLPMHQEGAPVTVTPDAPVAAR